MAKKSILRKKNSQKTTIMLRTWKLHFIPWLQLHSWHSRVVTSWVIPTFLIHLVSLFSKECQVREACWDKVLAIPVIFILCEAFVCMNFTNEVIAETNVFNKRYLRLKICIDILFVLAKTFKPALLLLQKESYCWVCPWLTFLTL